MIIEYIEQRSQPSADEDISIWKIYIKTEDINYKKNHRQTSNAQPSADMHEVGFEPTQQTLPGLKSGSLDHSDIRAKKIV